MTKRTYLDHNATAPVSEAAWVAMVPFLRDDFANPSSLHAPGVRVRAAVEDARRAMAASLGIRKSELFFTSGATESINWAIRGALDAQPDRRRIVTSAVEHTATLDVVTHLEKVGYRVERLPVDGDGRLDPARVVAALDDDTALLSLLAVNNETGVRFDVDAIGAIARDRGVLFHVDGVQEVGKSMTGVGARPIDLLSFSGHKFGAPKGIGGLFVRRGSRLRPLLWGGHHESGRRAGTENVPGIIAMAAALGDAMERWQRMRGEVGRLRDVLARRIVELVPDALLIGVPPPRIENTASVCFRGIEGAAVVLSLSAKGIDCSSGSACTATQEGPSHVLAAMDVPGDYVHGSVRFSLGVDHTEAEIEQAALEIGRVVEHVSRVNTF